MPGLEKPIRTMIDATNRADSETFLGAFADDAVLVDWGRTFSGKSEIARWNDDENIGARNQIRVTGVERSGKSVRVGVDVSGGGYNGSGSMIFEVEGDAITKLMIPEEP